MFSWKGTTRGGVAGYKTFVFILKYLGLPFAYFLLRFVVAYFLLFSFSSLRYLYFYFRKVQKFSFWKALGSVVKNYYIFGQILLDKIALMSGMNHPLTFDFDGEEILQKMVADKTGGLLISAHVGNFEIAGHLLKRLNTKVNIVMYDAEHQQIKEYLSRVLEGSQARIIVIKDDLSHIYALRDAFENKEIVCMHGDRFVKGSKTIEADFFGRQARFPHGPFFLAMKYHVPVSFVFAMKEKKYHYHFYAFPGKYYDDPSRNVFKRTAALQSIVNEYICSLEKMIKKHPEQWFNYYNFWEV